MSPKARPRRSLALVASLAFVLAGCAPEVARPPQALRGAPEKFPVADYRRLAAQGRPVFRIDPARSLLVIEARRGGSLARLGHDHVIAAHDLQGFIAPQQRRSDLYLRLDDLVVDEPELRAEAKLTTHPSADDIAGTRRNMLSAFEAEQHPFAVVHIDEIGEDDVRAAISLHGATRTQDLPVRIERGADEIAVAGELALRQSDFGIKPVSVLGGALQVADEVAIRFSIRGQRMR
jgi:hypothetical protein